MEQVAELLRPHDDAAGNYVLWVNAAGDVRLDRVSAGQTEDDFRDAHPDLRLWFRAFEPGNDKVGPGADYYWAEDVLWALQAEWQAAKGRPGAVHLGQI